ncbi:MAG: hypothetical protein GXY85_12740 [Candidatus Brocadiaceae bacterium]|nr:hypothetical protein [Candidatus Brocadiaceae bacterium]
MKRAWGLAGLACVVLVAAAGCHYGRQWSVSNVQGTVLAADRTAALQEGVTTVEEVVGAFGSPDRRERFDDGREVLTYVYGRTVRVKKRFMFVIGWTSETRRETHYYFEFRNGLLVRRWEQEEVAVSTGPGTDESA